MGAMASHNTSLTIVYSIVNSVADQRKHQSSASLAFVWEIHRWPVNSPHKWPVTRKMFPFDDIIMDFLEKNGSATYMMTWWYHRWRLNCVIMMNVYIIMKINLNVDTVIASISILPQHATLSNEVSGYFVKGNSPLVICKPVFNLKDWTRLCR